MSGDSLKSLLEQLCQGDAGAAEQVFREYEPYLRMVVRRMLPQHLRPKFDSVDVVQSVWVDLVQGFRQAAWHFQNPEQLRAFLVKATRNRFLDRQERYKTELQHEQTLAVTQMVTATLAHNSSPEELLQAQELWEQLLTLCAPQHQELLRLKRQGYTLGEIAQRTGFHPSSVRRIFYDLDQRLTQSRQKSVDVPVVSKRK